MAESVVFVLVLCSTCGLGWACIFDVCFGLNVFCVVVQAKGSALLPFKYLFVRIGRAVEQGVSRRL